MIELDTDIGISIYRCRSADEGSFSKNLLLSVRNSLRAPCPMLCNSTMPVEWHRAPALLTVLSGWLTQAQCPFVPCDCLVSTQDNARQEVRNALVSQTQDSRSPKKSI